MGADDYLAKPFNPAILRARIGAALRRASLRLLETEYLGRIEQEKRYSDKLLRNVLPPEISTASRNGAEGIADHFEDATVIFADVVGFGKITAGMKAFEIVGCLNIVFMNRQACRGCRGREDQDDWGQLHGHRRCSDAPRRTCQDGSDACTRYDCCNCSAEFAAARPVSNSHWATFWSCHGEIIGTRKFAYNISGRYGEHRVTH